MSHKELMCWNKYLHKKKKFEVTRKKKNEKSKSDDNFMLNSNLTFNLIFKSFLNTKSSASTLNFMSITDQHFLSVWIINTETLNHLCSMWEFFSSYQSVVWSLKMVNESAQIIEKNIISLHLVHFDSDIQKIVLHNVMYIFSSSANLISDCYIKFDNVIFNMTDCTLHYNDNIIEHVSEVNELF